jgi:hypothetical protein
LETIKQPQFRSDFQTNQVNGAALLKLTDADLKDDLKLPLGPRKVLLEQIDILRGVPPNATKPT